MNKLETQSKIFKIFAGCVLLIILFVSIGAYTIFTTTSLDISSTKIKDIQEKISDLNESDDIARKIITLKNLKFSKIEVYDLEEYYFDGYIKDVASLTFDEYVYISDTMGKIVDLLEKDDDVNYNYRDLLKSISKNHHFKTYYISPYYIERFEKEILNYTRKIHEYNNNNKDNEYASKVFVSLKWIKENDKFTKNYFVMSHLGYIFRLSHNNIDSLKEIKPETLSADALKFNDFIDERIKTEEEIISSIQKRKDDLNNDLVSEEDRIQKNQFYIYNSIVIKVSISILFILLIRILIELFRYTLKMSVFYSTKASLIQLMYELDLSDPEKIKDIFHAENIDFQSPDIMELVKTLVSGYTSK